jgi:hypothetical protein
MTHEARKALQRIIDYCSRQWTEADTGFGTLPPTPDEQTGMKHTYNSVFHYARALLDEFPYG